MKYLKLFLLFIRYNLVRDMEFRGNFLLLMLVDILWVSFQILLIEMYFQFTTSIFGWSQPQVFVLMGLFRIVKGIIDVFFRPNINQLPVAVNRGELDYILTKPQDSMFLVSVKRHAYTEFSTIVLGLAIFAYGLLLDGTFNFGKIVFLLFLLPFGTIMFYCLLFCFASLSLFIHRLSSTYQYYDILSNLFRFPTDFLGMQIRQLNLILFPLAIVATVPAKFILGKSGWNSVVAMTFISLITLALTRRFWFFALRRYQSASS